jgi:hypothetical protein
MHASLSLGQILAGLEERIAQLRERESHHAEREAFHREQRAAYGAELAKITERFEALRSSAEAVAELGILLPSGPPQPVEGDDLPAGKRPSINLAVQKVVSRLPPDRPFGPREVMEEVNRRYAGRLGGPVDMRKVSVSLRWLADTGRIHRAFRGRPHKESKYVRERPRKAGTA